MEKGKHWKHIWIQLVNKLIKRDTTLLKPTHINIIDKQQCVWPEWFGYQMCQESIGKTRSFEFFYDSSLPWIFSGCSGQGNNPIIPPHQPILFDVGQFFLQAGYKGCLFGLSWKKGSQCHPPQEIYIYINIVPYIKFLGGVALGGHP